MTRVVILLCLALLLAGTAHAGPCVLTWPAITEYTDGTEVTGEVLYRVWFQPQGAAPTQVQALVVTDTVGIILPDCRPGNFFVSAFQDSRPDILESAPSEAVVIPQREPTHVPTQEHGAEMK
jgi:hypothetical protein